MTGIDGAKDADDITETSKVKIGISEGDLHRTVSFTKRVRQLEGSLVKKLKLRQFHRLPPATLFSLPGSLYSSDHHGESTSQTHNAVPQYTDK